MFHYDATSMSFPLNIVYLSPHPSIALCFYIQLHIQFKCSSPLFIHSPIAIGDRELLQVMLAALAEVQTYIYTYIIDQLF
jgi:hypothetical protein